MPHALQRIERSSNGQAFNVATDAKERQRILNESCGNGSDNARTDMSNLGRLAKTALAKWP